MKLLLNRPFLKFIAFFIFILEMHSQNFFPADPYFLIDHEKKQFNGSLQLQPNIFRPIFTPSDSLSFTAIIRNEKYYNTNAPNQENMDIRYFSKGSASFTSFQLSINSPYLLFIMEPYMMKYNSRPVKNINRSGVFSVLNDQELNTSTLKSNNNLRNFLAFFHYKGLGIGWHQGNRWWGPGIHTTLQMTNNTAPFPAQIIGTMKEIRIGKIGLLGLYTFSNLNNKKGSEAKYYTAFNGQLTWYGPLILSLGFSRNYLTGGASISGYNWTEEDARKIIFEGIFTSNLIDSEYTVGGHDLWDQQISGYLSIIFPKRNLKIYSEVGFNDNRMYYADFLSQPDHSMATVIGVRDYGLSKNSNILWGLEWTNIMITYSSRHRGRLGAGTWYSRKLYDYNSYKGRRWGAHSGSDSDDLYIYAGYKSNKLMLMPGFNYERHGIVSHRPAEVKIEYRFDFRYKYNNIWFGLYLERQFEAFLGFPDYFYVDNLGNPIDSSEGNLASTRKTNTLIFSISRTINF
jgi:hypothetical protein